MHTVTAGSDRCRERGVALLLVVMMLLVISAMTAALALDAATEAAVAANHRNATEGLYAADAAMTRALVDLAGVSDRDAVLAGTVRSTFVDGPPNGVRLLSDDTTIDLAQVSNRATCGKPAGCSDADITAVTADRPWGANNPIWRLYAYGPVSALGRGVSSPFYAVVLVADDPAETDGDPLHDGISPSNPGGGLLAIRAVAFGPAGGRQAVDATVSVVAGLQVRSWRTGPP